MFEHLLHENFILTYFTDTGKAVTLEYITVM